MLKKQRLQKDVNLTTGDLVFVKLEDKHIRGTTAEPWHSIICLLLTKFHVEWPPVPQSTAKTSPKSGFHSQLDHLFQGTTKIWNLTVRFVLLSFLESKRAGGPNFQSMYDVHGFIVLRKPRSAKIIYTSAHGLDNQKRGDLSKRAFYFNELEMVPLGTLNELISAGLSVWRTSLAIISVSMTKRCTTIFDLHYHLFPFSYFAKF